MNIEVNVDTSGVKIELSAERDICPLCSWLDDHAHTVVLTTDPRVDDTVDGCRLPEDGREQVLEMIKGWS